MNKINLQLKDKICQALVCESISDIEEALTKKVTLQNLFNKSFDSIDNFIEELQCEKYKNNLWERYMANSYFYTIALLGKPTDFNKKQLTDFQTVCLLKGAEEFLLCLSIL